MSRHTEHLSVFVELSSDMLICEPSTQLATILSTASNLTMLEPSEHLETSNGLTTILEGKPSGSVHIASHSSVTLDKNQQRRDRDKARRDSLTPKQREEMNARRRAARQNKSNEERNASQRAARKIFPLRRGMR